MDSKRWVWLELYILTETRGAFVTKSIYVPEKVIDQIPSYKAQLQRKLALIKDDKEPTILDTTGRDQESISKAIRFLTNGYLTPLDAASHTCDKSLASLVDLYKLSIDMSITALEYAVLWHIGDLDFQALPRQKFLWFARTYYRAGADTQHTSLGKLIKKKVASLLPYLQQSMTVEELSSEGGILGKQLIAVLLEDRAKAAEVESESDEGPSIKHEFETFEDWLSMHE